jgi:hypothetical protein
MRRNAVIRGAVLCLSLLPLAAAAQAPGLPPEAEAVCGGLEARHSACRIEAPMVEQRYLQGTTDCGDGPGGCVLIQIG